MNLTLKHNDMIIIDLPSGGTVCIGCWDKMVSVTSDIHIDSEPVINTETDLLLDSGTVCTTFKKQVTKSNGYMVLVDTSIYRRKS
jgi:hypothetical protein